MSGKLRYESYLEYLERRRRENMQQSEQAQKPDSLEERISQWWEKLPLAEKNNAFSMAYMCSKFSSRAQILGPTLTSLGWERKRLWKKGQTYSRYWTKDTD